MKNVVDFLVIGAQKSGTTSLFKYMENHPSLYLPPQKEVNFFVSPKRSPLDIDWYLQTHFSGVAEDRLWGEVSPSYMSYSAAPGNIYNWCPDVKLVAILRNPIDRTYSHYRMTVRRGTESRTFRRAVEELSRDRARVPETKVPDDSPFLLEFGRYWETLSNYLRYFDREQILILFQEDLDSRPEEVLVRLFSFLGVDDGYRPPNLGKSYHVSGGKRFFGLGGWLRQRKTLKRAAKRILVSKRSLDAARFWFEQINIKPVKDEGPTPGERRLLQQIFEEDVASLEHNFRIKTPWPEFGAAERISAP